MTEQEVRLLLEKYNSGNASADEKALLEHWYFNQLQYQELADPQLDLDQLKAEIWQGTLEKSKLSERKITGKNSIYTIAAAIILFMGVGVFFYIHLTMPVQRYTVEELSKQDIDIKPGSNRATLTLADGRVIDLSDEKGGIIIDTDALTYTDGTEISGSSDSRNPSSSGGEITYNSITTPKGGQYQIVLPDGSRVWLNAASTLKYPSLFNSDERRVELSGEAYFEIARVSLRDNKTAKPFIVKSPTQEVEVLGTHFNIQTYDEGALATTTLLEGSVNIHPANADQILKLTPGQQSIVQSGKKTRISEADLDEAIGWKNGEFIFYDESIEKVMKDVARWYDVEIIYKDAVQNKKMWGSVSKFESISEVLKMIELTGAVRFDIQLKGDERRVYVMK